MREFRVQGLHYWQNGPVDFSLRAGECVGLSGPSGSGKTLLLRALADLDPHEGAVSLDNNACADMPATRWRRRVALLPAESAWWRDHVGEHFPGGLPENLDWLGFGPEVLNWQVSRLSSGERQRLALLRLLGHEPEVLLLDEPTANLDGENALRVEALLTDYVNKHNAAMLWVSHDPAQIKRVTQRHLRLEKNGIKVLSKEEVGP